MKLLIADDEISIRSMVATLLAKDGYEVTQAANGLEALDLLSESPIPMLVVLDWTMPGMDGIEVCRTLRKQAVDLHHYIILLTGRSNTDDMIIGLDAGADDFISKPFNPGVLRARLRVGQRKLSQQSNVNSKVQDLQSALTATSVVPQLDDENDVLEILTRHKILPEGDLQRLAEHWHQEPHRSETLSAMLVREGILAPQYSSTLSLLRSGMLRSIRACSPLTAHGKERFQELLDKIDQTLSDPIIVDPNAPPAPEIDATAGTPNPARTRSFAVSETPPRRAPGTPAPPSSYTYQARLGGGMPRVGDTLGKCLLTTEIARGASAIVFEGLHTSLHIPVAIKVFMADNASADEHLRRQFRAEALLLARLHHPNMVHILDFEECDYPYLVLEFVNGFSLNELIHNRGHVALAEATTAILRTAEALTYAHSQHVVHRDVKPANIMVDREGIVKLADLGISRISTAIVDPGPTGGNSYRLCGTPAYVAPEQAFSPDSVDGRADIYSLGATWYHAVTGALPFQAKTSHEMILKHVSARPTPPHQIRPGIPEEVSQMILRMMGKKPQDRYASMAEVTQNIQQLMATDPNLNISGQAPGERGGSISVIMQRSLAKLLGRNRG